MVSGIESQEVLVTVVVPVFNAVSTLPACLDSVLAQTHKALQIIVVNDGSSDGSAELLESYRRRYAEIQVIATVNQGASEARNQGMSHALGSYLMFVDADDTIQPQAVETLLTAIVETDSDLATAGHLQSRDGGVLVNKSGEVGVDRVFSDVELCRYILAYMHEPYTYTMLVHCWNKLYKRDILKNGLQFNPELTQLEDVDFNFRYLINCKTVCYRQAYLYTHTISSGRMTMSNLTGSENDAMNKFWLAYQSIAAYLSKNRQQCGFIDVENHLGHLYVTTVIISLIRLCKSFRIIGLFRVWRQIRYITSNQRLIDELKHYSPGKNDSRCIYWALKLGSPVLVMVFSLLRAWFRQVDFKGLFLIKKVWP